MREMRVGQSVPDCRSEKFFSQRTFGLFKDVYTGKVLSKGCHRQRPRACYVLARTTPKPQSETLTTAAKQNEERPSYSKQTTRGSKRRNMETKKLSQDLDRGIPEICKSACRSSEESIQRKRLTRRTMRLICTAADEVRLPTVGRAFGCFKPGSKVLSQDTRRQFLRCTL